MVIRTGVSSELSTRRFGFQKGGALHYQSQKVGHRQGSLDAAQAGRTGQVSLQMPVGQSRQVKRARRQLGVRPICNSRDQASECFDDPVVDPERSEVVARTVECGSQIVHLQNGLKVASAD